jgi:hypothetical protein
LLTITGLPHLALFSLCHHPSNNDGTGLFHNTQEAFGIVGRRNAEAQGKSEPEKDQPPLFGGFSIHVITFKVSSSFQAFYYFLYFLQGLQ